MKRYDAVVIGSGVAGATAAYALKKGGKTVALVEHDLWGGTCPNRGCDPKKVLAAGMEAVTLNNQLAGKGLTAIPSIHWPELMAFKRSFTEPYPREFKEDAQKSGIDAMEGTARFLDENRLQAGDEVLEADSFVIATGQRPAMLDIPGREHLKTSEDFLEMDALPKSILFIGAGYIAVELAAIACAAGSRVSIVDKAPRPLLPFDGELAADLRRAYEEKGIRFAFGVDVRQVAREGGQLVLSGPDFSATAECVICAVGRVPNVEGLGLDKAGVRFDEKGVPVNEYMQTTNPRVYACGDVLAKEQPRLTPVAAFEGSYVAQKILGETQAAISYPPVASVVFGSPKLAEVGVSPRKAGEEPGRYTVKQVDMTGWFSNRRLNGPVAKAKLVFEGGLLAGAGLLGGQADDLINYLAILIGKRVTHQELERMIFAWPTTASDLSSLV